ncbi:MAG: tyrosine-protein phosphatase [Acetobacteraceae bacterium]|nr:tyrosine-protein phosphatase [Acetobacteraceae bacterium]
MYRGSLIRPADRAIAWIDAFFIDHGFTRVAWPRFAAVLPGRLYRSSHPLPGRLASLTRRHGIRTLINLRGKTHNGADALARETADTLGLHFVDAPLESRGAPQADRVLRLAETYRTMAEPALVHCKSGADRAGLASGIYLLVHGGTAKQALKQLSLRFGHIAQSRTGVLDAFFHLYARDAEGRKAFLDWVREDYDREELIRHFRAGGLGSFINDRLLLRE